MSQDLINQILKASKEVTKTLPEDLRPLALRKIEAARKANTLKAAYTAGADIEYMAEKLPVPVVAPDPSKVASFGYDIHVLERAFEEISNPEDWKDSIAATVPGELVAVSVAAVKFYTATVPTVTLNTRTMEYTIESIGYRMGPAGDH